MRNTWTMILPVALGLILCGTAVAQEATVESWAEALGSAATSSADRQAALVALGAIAGGPTDQPETRDASFALADYWLEQGPAAVGPEGIRALDAATTFFGDDPRTGPILRGLALAQLHNGDAYGAHGSFRRFIETGGAADDQLFLAQAADNAANVGDAALAFEWSQQVDPKELPLEDRTRLRLARLKAATALNRSEEALESARILSKDHRDALAVDALALFAAAKTYESVGLLDEAMSHLDTFVNVHPLDPERPYAMLRLGRMASRTGQIDRARRTLTWLVERHPASSPAHDATLDLLEIDGNPADPVKINGYIDAMRKAGSHHDALAVCQRFADRFIAAGLPMEIAESLVVVVREDEGLSQLAAEVCLERALEPVIALLASRDDHMAIVATAAGAESVGAKIPDSQLATVKASRRSLGLPETAPGMLEETIEAARKRLGRGKTKGLLEELDMALLLTPAPEPDSRGEVERLAAEVLWRDRRGPEAVSRIRKALKSEFKKQTARRLRVLLADILYTEGELDDACIEYRRALETLASPWVESQVTRCSQREGRSS